MNSKCKLRLPDIKELQGENALDSITIRGVRTKMSDFALMTGGFYNSEELTNYKNLPSDLDYEYYEQDTKYITGNIKDDNVITVGGLEGRDISKTRRKDDNVGTRLVLDVDDDSILSNANITKREDGVTEVELGDFPRRRISNYNEREKLQKAIKKGKFKETPYEYTIDTKLLNEWAKNGYGKIKSSKRKVRAYEYKNKLYIKFDMPMKDSYEYNEELVEVLPVKWWYDVKKKKMITEDVLAYGVEFDNINPLLDNMSRELFQTEERNKQKEGIKALLGRLVNKRNKLKALPNGTQEIKENNEIMGKDEIIWEPNKTVDINECLNRTGHSFIERLRSWKHEKVGKKHGNEVSRYAPKKTRENHRDNSEDSEDIDI